MKTNGLGIAICERTIAKHDGVGVIALPRTSTAQISQLRRGKWSLQPSREKEVMKQVPRENAALDYVVNDQIGYILRVSVQRHTSIFTSMMIEGITQTQFAALAKLHQIGPCSHNKLGRLIALDAPTIKGVLDRLQARKLAVSVADPKHRSRRTVALTEKGARITRAAIKVGKKITERTLATLTHSERTRLIELLHRLNRDL